jgi:uncharacterized membrane protein
LYKGGRIGDNNGMNRLLLYGGVGLLIEVFWTGAYSMIAGDARLTATTYLWMMPIYGFFGMVSERLHERIRTYPVLVRGLVWAGFIFVVEYACGYLLRVFLGVCPWDYSSAAYAVDGLIRLDYAPAWFFLGLLFEHLHDYLSLNTIKQRERPLR